METLTIGIGRSDITPALGVRLGGYEPWVGKAYDAYLLADTIDDALVDEQLRLLNHLGELTLTP